MKKRVQKTDRRGIFWAVFVLAAMLALPGSAFSAPPEGKGGGSSGDHGRRPPDPGGTTKGDILGDLWVVVRDVGTGGNGEPIHLTWTWPDEYYDESGDLVIPTGGLPTDYTIDENSVCVQPISFTELTPPPKADGTQFTYDYVNSYGNTETVYLIPLDAECNIPDVYAGTWGLQVTEVDSGRLALARTTQYVIDAAYEEALTALNTATSVGLGPAGRLLIGLTDGTERIIDSPRENLALYQRVMKDGCLSPTENVALTDTAETTIRNGGLRYLVCGTPDPDPNLLLQRAASFLAGAADKSGDIGIDEVVYLNSILGINTVETSPTGSNIVTGYFDFDDFTYVRSDRFNKPGEEVKANLLQPPLGWTENDGYPDHFVVPDQPVSIYSAVFNSVDWTEPTDNETYPHMPVINFVRAADDAVSVIFYIHNYELPVYPVPFEAAPPTTTLQQRNQLQGPVFLQ